MRRIPLAFLVAALSVTAWPATPVRAQAPKTARGTITAMTDDSLILKVGAQDMKFSVDTTTAVEATGGATKTRAAKASRQPGPKLSEVVKVGQAVIVCYADMGGTLHASRVRAVTAAGAGGGSVSSGEPTEMTSNGTLKSVTADSLTITGQAGGGASFTPTRVIDTKTTVVGKGVGTATAATGGKAQITTLVAVGDHVVLSYDAVGATQHASDVRVTAKGTASK
jgi:hypothetical protein